MIFLKIFLPREVAGELWCLDDPLSASPSNGNLLNPYQSGGFRRAAECRIRPSEAFLVSLKGFLYELSNEFWALKTFLLCKYFQPTM